MNTKERFLSSANAFRDTCRERIGKSATRWLNVAYKLDYISLDHKERIDTLLQKEEAMRQFGAVCEVFETDVEELTEIQKIANVTRFSPLQLKGAE